MCFWYDNLADHVHGDHDSILYAAYSKRNIEKYSLGYQTIPNCFLRKKRNKTYYSHYHAISPDKLIDPFWLPAV